MLPDPLALSPLVYFLGRLLAWLRAAVHRHGAKFVPQELVRRATGSPIDPAPYLRYLEGKLAAIYGG